MKTSISLSAYRWAIRSMSMCWPCSVREAVWRMCWEIRILKLIISLKHHLSKIWSRASTIYITPRRSLMVILDRRMLSSIQDGFWNLQILDSMNSGRFVCRGLRSQNLSKHHYYGKHRYVLLEFSKENNWFQEFLVNHLVQKNFCKNLGRNFKNFRK